MTSESVLRKFPSRYLESLITNNKIGTAIKDDSS